MTVTTRSGRTIKFAFMHSSPFVKDAETGVVRIKSSDNSGVNRAQLDTLADLSERRMTVCEVVEQVPDGTQETGSAYNVLGQGVAICHPTDPFRKATGRKLSLTYALRAASSEPEAALPVNVVSGPQLTRDDRADVWAYYLKEFQA